MAYVYRHIRLDKNEPFYIGVGSDDVYKRANDTKGRNKIWYDITKKTDYEVEILFDNISWEDALSKEIEFIDLYKRMADKKVTNTAIKMVISDLFDLKPDDFENPIEDFSTRKINDISTIETALQQYKVDNNYYPPSDTYSGATNLWGYDSTKTATTSNKVIVSYNGEEIQSVNTGSSIG